jgi:ParB family chromosome partitioning protein
MAKRPGLGRGLDALIPGKSEQQTPSADPTQIEIHLIKPNPHQPRAKMDPLELQELADSIKEHGIIQPLIVLPSNDGKEYVLIAGERRLRAAELAGLKTVPVIFRNASEKEQLELALIENAQRSDLSPIELAEAYQKLSQTFNLSHEEIANRVGKSRVSVTNTLRLLKLPEKVRLALIEKAISEGHARAILTLSSAKAQVSVLDIIIKNGYSVRQTEELVRKYGGERTKKTVPVSKLPEIKALEERFREELGMKVNLDHHGDKGRIIIYYYSNEELNAFNDRLTGD